MTQISRSLRFAALVAGAFLALIPAVVVAHAELETSTPANGSTVASPFDGPIVLTFTEALTAGSEADLLEPGGARVASAEVDGPDATMTFELTEPLDPGEYEVQWTALAADGHVERGTIEFTVDAPPPTPEPTPTPTEAPTDAPPTSPPATQSPSPPLTPTPDGGSTAGTSDVLIPIIVALLIVGAGGAYLLARRNRPIQP